LMLQIYGRFRKKQRKSSTFFALRLQIGIFA